jgi:hypothetical protein
MNYQKSVLMAKNSSNCIKNNDENPFFEGKFFTKKIDILAHSEIFEKIIYKVWLAGWLTAWVH